MVRILTGLFAVLLLISCSEKIEQQSEGGLRKIAYSSPEELNALKEAGAEIIVQEPDYVIVRTDEMLQALDVKSTPIEEADLVQRLCIVTLKDSTSLQKIVDTGVDLWQITGDSAIVRAFDLYINRLEEAGLQVQIIARDASKWEGWK